MTPGTLSDGLFWKFFKDLHNVSFLFISVLDYPCNLLQVDKEFLATKLTSRVMKTTWGGNTEEVVVTNNIQQAESTRDALAKGIYSRIFDFLVEVCTLYRYQNIRSAKFIYPEHQSFLPSNQATRDG